jgi:hypothetical protein
VFLLRGGDGDLRLLRNEIAVAEHLAKTRGFRIIDPLGPMCRVSSLPAPGRRW